MVVDVTQLVTALVSIQKGYVQFPKTVLKIHTRMCGEDASGSQQFGDKTLLFLQYKMLEFWLSVPHQLSANQLSNEPAAVNGIKPHYITSQNCCC